MPGLDLMQFVAKPFDYDSTIIALESLGKAANGPLRVTCLNTAPQLGVRTWTQFFKEHLFHDHLYVEKREERTQQAVENFLTNLGTKAPKNPVNEKDKLKAARMAQAIYKLRAKASGRDRSPRLGKTVYLSGATTEPKYNNVHKSSIKTFLGKIFIPQGLSIGTVPIGKVIADRLFGYSLVHKHDTSYGKAEPIKIPHGPTEYLEDAYFDFYKKLFGSIKEGENSVAIELFKDPKFKVSDANRNGAWRAASEFVARRKTLGKDVSVLLCVDKMPDLEAEPPKASGALRPIRAQTGRSSGNSQEKQHDGLGPLLVTDNASASDSDSEETTE